MDINWLVVLGTAFIPMVTGFIWYHPKVMGTVWMKEANMTEEMIQGGNMALIFGVSFVFAFLLAVEMNFIVVHQNHFMSILMNEPGLFDKGSEMQLFVEDFMTKYGRNFRTFKHGLFHGVVAGFIFALPVLGTNALFERKSFKYIMVNGAYWMITIGLMGGVIGQWA